MFVASKAHSTDLKNYPTTGWDRTILTSPASFPVWGPCLPRPSEERVALGRGVGVTDVCCTHHLLAKGNQAGVLNVHSAFWNGCMKLSLMARKSPLSQSGEHSRIALSEKVLHEKYMTLTHIGISFLEIENRPKRGHEFLLSRRVFALRISALLRSRGTGCDIRST